MKASDNLTVDNVCASMEELWERALASKNPNETFFFKDEKRSYLISAAYAQAVRKTVQAANARGQSEIYHPAKWNK